MLVAFHLCGCIQLTLTRQTNYSWRWIFGSFGAAKYVNISLYTENRCKLTFLDVTTIHKEIVKIVPEGVVDEDGTVHKVDILICATGFNLAFAPPLWVTFLGSIIMN